MNRSDADSRTDWTYLFSKGILCIGVGSHSTVPSFLLTPDLMNDGMSSTDGPRKCCKQPHATESEAFGHTLVIIIACFEKSLVYKTAKASFL